MGINHFFLKFFFSKKAFYTKTYNNFFWTCYYLSLAVLGSPAGDPPGVFTDCFAYTQDISGNFLSPSLKRVFCSLPSFFICQLGKYVFNCSIVYLIVFTSSNFFYCGHLPIFYPWWSLTISYNTLHILQSSWWRY